ncbi:MAG: hypothetical protein P1U40_06935 [Coxiellaceae bacterium]|nr:hypothetical protein [Coxiellaceae bacterium]
MSRDGGGKASKVGDRTSGHGIFPVPTASSGGASSAATAEDIAKAKALGVPLTYSPSMMESLSDGYSAVSVDKVTDLSTGASYVLKQSRLEQNINAVLVSEFLKPLLNGRDVAVDGRALTYHVPTVILTRNHLGKLVQQQEFLTDLNTRLEGKRLQGLASFDNLQQMATFGVIYQFLMLGDNMAYNHRISDGKGSYNIFDFDEAFILGGRCVTSDDSPIADKVEAVGHALNNHFFDLLALRYGRDRYRNIRFHEPTTITPLSKETWADFFKGIQEGLRLIKENFSADFIMERWGSLLPEEAQTHLQTIRALTLGRLSHIDHHLQYIGELLEAKHTLCELDISTPINASLDAQPSVHGYLDMLKQAMVSDVRAITSAVAADSAEAKPLTP